MGNIEKKVEALINENKTKDSSLDKFLKKIEYIEKMYPIEKPSYNLPLRDTIGRTYYNRVNTNMA